MTETYEEVCRRELKYLNEHYRNGWVDVEEADGYLNMMQFEKLQAFAHKLKVSTIWVGIINKYEGMDDKPWLWEYNPEQDEPQLYIFGAAFYLPAYDQTVVDLLQERRQGEYTGTKQDLEKIEAIFDRVDKLGGMPLIWT